MTTAPCITTPPNRPRFRGHPEALLLDCDGVLLSWIDGFRTYAERRLGRSLCPEGPRSFDLNEWLGLVELSEALELVRDFNEGDDGQFGKLDPLPGAVEALKAFAETGRELHIITACSIDAGVISMRKANLRAVFGDIFGDIHCVGMRDSKVPLLDEYHAATWVEDKFENAVAGVDSGHHTYLIRASHNRHREADTMMRGLQWVDGWTDITAFESAR